MVVAGGRKVWDGGVGGGGGGRGTREEGEGLK